MSKFRTQLLGWPCYWTPNRSILKEGSFCQTAKILQDSKTAWAFVLGILKTRRISGKWQNIELIWKKSFQNQTIALKWKIQELLQRGKSQPSRLRENKLTTEPFWKREPIYHRIWKRQESKGRVFLFVCRFVFVIVFFFLPLYSIIPPFVCVRGPRDHLTASGASKATHFFYFDFSFLTS